MSTLMVYGASGYTGRMAAEHAAAAGLNRPGFQTPGKDGYPSFWIHDKAGPGKGTHVAFTATEHSTVDEFYRAAVAAGGVDNGAPGIRHHYHEHYYAAYVLDPDGINVEVVCQTPT